MRQTAHPLKPELSVLNSLLLHFAWSPSATSHSWPALSLLGFSSKLHHSVPKSYGTHPFHPILACVHWQVQSSPCPISPAVTPRFCCCGCAEGKTRNAVHLQPVSCSRESVSEPWPAPAVAMPWAGAHSCSVGSVLQTGASATLMPFTAFCDNAVGMPRGNTSYWLFILWNALCNGGGIVYLGTWGGERQI